MVPHFQTLEVLQEHGIAANDIQKLQAAGYHTVESVSRGNERMTVSTILLLTHTLSILNTISDCSCYRS
jgi:vancomycin permeability regulator SanA